MAFNILTEISAVTLTCLITIVSIYLYRFYSKLNIYPCGPLPVPIIGNLHLLYDRKKHAFLKFADLAEKYGKVFTFWFGSTPAIIITDCEAGVEAFKTNACAGRAYMAVKELFRADTYHTFIFEDYTPKVKHIRKVSIEAMRNIKSTENFRNIVCDYIDEIVAAIKERENSAIHLKIYFMPLFTKIMGELLFEKKYSFDDKEIEFIMKTNDSISKDGVLKMSLHFVPLLKYLKFLTQTTETSINKLFNTLETNYERCLQLRNNSNKYSNICNALISSSVELIDKQESDFKLDKQTIIGTINVLLFGGSDTTSQTILFMLLIMVYYPDIQIKLRKEVKEVIDFETPQLSDQNRFHYLRAFIMETLRFRNVVPIGIPRKNVERTTIAGHLIPQNTMLMLHQYSVLHDTDHWTNPKQFIPERFLDSNGELINKRLPAFILFGSGKRVCPGEQLAMDVMFFTIVRLMQSTVGYEIVLANEPPVMDLDPSMINSVLETKHYNIILKKNK